MSNNTTREIIARAVCWVAICNEGTDETAVDGRWEGYLEDADAAITALSTAGYKIVKEQPS